MNRKEEYIFNKTIVSNLRGFKSYLKQLGNDINTIRQKSNYTGYFLTWRETENLQETTYNDMLSFVGHCRETGKSKKHINSILRSVRNYYEYLKQKDNTITNPVANLYIRGEKRTVPHNNLPFELLEEVYIKYPAIDNRTKRNKVILGLFIYQGITTDELKRLQTYHVNLEDGKITIPGSKRSNKRVLALKPFQVMAMHEYIKKIRPVFLLSQTNQLFISAEGCLNIKNSVHHLFRAVKLIDPQVKNAKQIRISVITHWLKQYNLRQVQYMAGHRYVSSTERYQVNNLEGLKKEIDEYHPLK